MRENLKVSRLISRKKRCIVCYRWRINDDRMHEELGQSITRNFTAQRVSMRWWKYDFESGIVMRLTDLDERKKKIICTSIPCFRSLRLFTIIHKPDPVLNPSVTKPQIAYRMHVSLNEMRVWSMTVICSLRDSPSHVLPLTRVSHFLCNVRHLQEEKFNLPPSSVLPLISYRSHTDSLHSQEE
jgi:hypothetical protein